jgi:hypothetical protein
MAWQYTESFGIPYLTDFVKGDFKFSVENHGRVTGTTATNITFPSGETIEAVQYETDNRLLPCFHFRVGSNKSSIQNLKLTNRGLVKELWTPDKSNSESLGEPRLFHYRPAGYGRFNDFRLIGEYAIKRLHAISTEIVLPPERFPHDIPDNATQEIQEFRENCLQVVSWEKTQAEICYHFFNYFIVSMFSEVDKKGRLRKKRKPFPDSEESELKALVEPLNPYKK